jgi:uncharacterized membrane protein YfcA
MGLHADSEFCLPQEFLTPLLLFGAGLTAGTLNSIAGGGSLLTLPLLIFLGLPPTVANGTNRVAILAMTIGATASFRRRRLISRPWLAAAVPPALLGVLLGTWVAVQIGDLAFQRILAAILVLAAAWTVWHPVKAPRVGDESLPVGGALWLLRAAFFLVGAYGGFITAGVGFIVLAVTSAGGLDLVRGNAVKVSVVMAFTLVALPMFAYNGLVDWGMGLILAAGTFTGGLVGVRLQVLKGQGWVRGVVTATIVIFAVRLLITG